MSLSRLSDNKRPSFSQVIAIKGKDQKIDLINDIEQIPGIKNILCWHQYSTIAGASSEDHN